MRVVRGGVSAGPRWDTSNPDERLALQRDIAGSRRNVERFDSSPSHPFNVQIVTVGKAHPTGLVFSLFP